MKRNKKISFLLTGEQWLGVLILLILVLGTLVIVRHWQPKQPKDTIIVTDSTRNEFANYQNQQDSIRKAQWKKKYKRDTIEIRMQLFDPNTVDSSTLVHLGFKPWQAKNMLKYRAKGGKYRKPEDLKKLYGMTDSMYLALTPYIRIARDTIKIDSISSDSLRHDSLPKWHNDNKDTILNLRTADTTELKMIYGIGSYRARQIVRYRQQLGGFVDVRQLLEIPGMENLNSDSLLSHFFLDTIILEPLKVNIASVNRLARHPYLRFEQAKAIYEFRRRKIRIDSIQQLETLDCLNINDFEKIAPYLNFDKK